jgi:SNF2 family DNA or RNA helicase
VGSFVKNKRKIPFDGIVFDEISKMNSTTNRVRSFRKVANQFKWCTGLTGTPASNGYIDLHGQFLVVDKGERLGTSKTAFRNLYYHEAGTFRYVPYHDTEDRIKKRIGDITLEMSCEDYNPLPKLLINDINLEMPWSVRKLYEKMEKDFFIVLDNGSEIEVFNQVSLTNKCLQFSNGNVYPVPGDPKWEPVHDLKLNALEDIIEEANGSPVLCSYAYRSDASRIMEKFKSIHPINLTECKTEKALKDAMKKWKDGSCRLMIGHPASLGHGIDGLQDAGHIVVWFGLTWSLDLYEQMNARVRRQGQGSPVICHRILCSNTLDQAQVLALDSKSTTQQDLRSAVKKYQKMKESC